MLEASAKRSLGSESNGRVRSPLVLANGKVASLSRGVDLAALDEAGWKSWGRHLRQRKGRPTLAKLTDTRGAGALLWELPCPPVDDETRDVLDQISSTATLSKASGDDAATIVKAWLAERSHEAPDVALAIEALAWGHALPRLAAGLASTSWCSLLESLLGMCHDASAISPDKQPLAHQLLAGELGLTLAYALPEIECCRQLAKPSRAALAEGIYSSLDGEGEIAGQHTDIARPLLACWTRCALLSKQIRKRVFRSDAATLFESFLVQNFAAMRADGTPMLAADGQWDKRLFAAALDLSGKGTPGKLAKLVLPGKKRPSARSDSKNEKLLQRLPDPAASSEWASTALLRASWTADSPRLLLDYSSEKMRSELFVDNNVIWRGECSPEITVDGDRLALASDWQEICWHADEDVVYAEIEASYDGGWKCQRQFLLDRRDRLFFVADALLGSEAGDLEYACSWPIADSLHVATEQETTEVSLTAGKKTICRALPLALPEWKSDGRRAGALGQVEGGLRYTLRTKTTRAYIPLCLDLYPARMKYPYTWRQLSVGRDLQRVAPDEAVGYRVQLRLDQWLIYRSLAPVASRTVLGQNYFYEFVCGRFDRDGDVDPLIEVE